ncbi:hypothetical protein LI99_00850 [Mycolicibacterium smegmatis]|uniref:Uncharacterized protein n=1 Tax=Mycolicibacterium smegmatis (strain ATCC 700084 / mc(2)155) TaxID=246196 RepID=A0QNU7_MYCS2|nr:hypothetical protein MSMEG_0169 [Mycolicibacterium smegmatis MC2 155]AIU12075.1 hypothetical protein LI99_00850 [Mycolicibacterium smegmatis]AIU05450.1 hypothetical protein LJ00_00850 [Mycolicibacterium smegmatis MC2 155]AIU18699.1 hypothetical protein LI98_00850 [Mycolicibacterium smegmatis]TBH27396.1 hypothetical protein EYS45_30605 [Mycolicibacterium smegmatis MC2 155]
MRALKTSFILFLAMIAAGARLPHSRKVVVTVPDVERLP